MSNMVIFQTPDGSPGYNQFESVEEAVRFIEKLRNDQGIEGARMFRLEEIQYQLKPYYKVELQALTTTTGGGSEGPASSTPPASSPSPSSPPPSAQGPGAGPSPAFAPPSGPPSAQPSAPSTPPADQPGESSDGEDQPQRRGLFGR